MPLQNKVTPYSDIVATPARGIFMGNRGVLHDKEQRLGDAMWRNTRWIVCSLMPRAAPRIVMAPGHYTELFFLDEATALAAGHRPCAECRRDAFRAFAGAWATSMGDGRVPKAPEIDQVLHAARLKDRRTQKTTMAPLGKLPDGAFIRQGEEAWLRMGGRLLRWTFNGYDRSTPASPSQQVTVLTPEPTLVALANGYRPVLHPSASL
jgi:hypothetical protein